MVPKTHRYNPAQPVPEPDLVGTACRTFAANAVMLAAALPEMEGRGG